MACAACSFSGPGGGTADAPVGPIPDAKTDAAGGDGPTDAKTDARADARVDAEPDATVMADCMTDPSYTTVGTSGSTYRQIAGSDDWLAAELSC